MRAKFLLMSIGVIGVGIAALSGCGASSDAGRTDATAQGGFAGKWRGVLSGGLLGNDLVIDVDLKPVTTAGSRFLDGTMKTNSSLCFNNASALAEFTGTSLNSLGGSGNGTGAQQTSINITGELAGDKITGLFQMSSLVLDCDIDTMPIVLNRQ